MQEGYSVWVTWIAALATVALDVTAAIVVYFWYERLTKRIEDLKEDLEMAEYVAAVVADLSRTSKPTCVSKPTPVGDLISSPESWYGFVDWTDLRNNWNEGTRVLLPQPAPRVMNRVLVVSGGKCKIATLPDEDEGTE